MGQYLYFLQKHNMRIVFNTECRSDEDFSLSHRKPSLQQLKNLDDNFISRLRLYTHIQQQPNPKYFL